MKALSCHDAETLRLRVYDLEARNAALDTQLHALMTSAGDVSKFSISHQRLRVHAWSLPNLANVFVGLFAVQWPPFFWLMSGTFFVSAGDISGEAALAAAQEVWRRAFESARAENQSETNLTKARLAEGLEAERGERERLVMEAAQSRLLYRAKGRQFRTVREELAASERRGEELERGIVGLRNEVEGWQRRVELLEAELRICGEELGGCREEVENAHAVGGAAEERWRGEEARRKEAELEVSWRRDQGLYGL